MAVRITDKIKEKLLTKHGVTFTEVFQCFLNRTHTSLIDVTEDHRTDPPTRFFISRTNHERELIVYYIQRGKNVDVKTVFEPGQSRRNAYFSEAKPLP